MPGPVVLRIKLRYDNLDVMVQRFAPNVGKSGLFLPTKSIQPIGTELKFELRLANDTAALVGVGRVKHVKPPDPANPKAAFGMAIELMRVSREGREVIIRMIERRRAMGLPDVAIPIPEDLEASRRAELDSQPRADTSGIVREAMAQFASAPVSEAVLASPPPGPIAVARDSAPLLTAPRSTELSKPVPVLAPEPARPKRLRLADVIAKAESGPVAMNVPELDEHVDVERALARARMLATGDLDAELAAVRESAAAPIEISIEAASAELARQLGGHPTTKRDRSARWAPPPAIVDPTISLAVETAPPPPPPPAPPEPPPIVDPVIALAVETAPPPDEEVDDAFTVNASTTTAVDPEPIPPEQPMLIDDESDPSSFERAFSEGDRLNTGDLLALDPDEPVERTMIAGHPADALADQLDRQLDEAEHEADDDEEISDLDVLAEADEDDADLLQSNGEGDASLSHDAAPAYDGEYADAERTAYGESVQGFSAELPDEPVEEEPAARPSGSFDFAARLDLEDSLDRALDGAEEEFDAEAAREFDREAAREFDAERPRNLDSVLDERPLPPDLEEDDDPANEFSEYPPTQAPERPSSSYTFAEQFPDAANEFEDDAGYTPGPPVVRAPAPQPGDLEDALAALDVDDVDTQLPSRPSSASGARPLPGLPEHRPATGPVRTVAHTVPRESSIRPPARSHTMPPPVPAAALRKPPTQQVPVAPQPRATTDDGIVIDFDDDE